VSLVYVAAGIRSLCGFGEHAQDGCGVERSAEWAGVSLSSLAARIRSLCGF
jgi:hypothetical protein